MRPLRQLRGGAVNNGRRNGRPVTVRIGDRIRAREFGVGTIMRFEHPERVVVLFDEQGYRTLSLSLVLDHDLLSEAS